jgi:transposase
MQERFVLMEDDKEKLVDEILDLRQRNKDLAAQNEKLRLENEVLKKQPATKPDKKPDFLKISDRRGLPPHRWGRKPGHLGVTRPKPAHIDREVVQELSTCPDCRHALGPAVDREEHIQEDIVPAKVEATRFVHCRYWCPGCKALVTAPPAPDEIPHSYLGPQTLATMVWLKYHVVVPGNKIVALFKDLMGLTVSEGAVAQALQRLAHHLGVEAGVVLAVLKAAPVKHVDETGWKINGSGRWLWSVADKLWSYTRIADSRGSKIPKELLGHPFTGVIVADFFSAYNKMQGVQQKCIVHLRREVRKCRADHPPPDFTGPEKKLKRLLADADRLAERRERISRLLFARRVRRLKARLFHFATDVYSHKAWQRLSARLLKHKDQIFTFLDVPGVPPDNNHAERAIRPHVILRNRSFHNRTDAGAHAHSVLTSLVQTLLLQNRPVIPALASSYLAHRHGVVKPTLFTSAG